MGNKEIWAPVADAVGVYEVSSMGRLRCLIQGQGHRRRELKPSITNAGYRCYRYLKNDGHYRYVGIQRIMMEAFIPVPDHLSQYVGTRYLHVNHKDENPANNTIENLEWCSAKYNTGYGTALKRRQDTKNKHGMRGCFVKVNQLSLDGVLIKTWDSMAQAAAALDVHRSQICCCCKGTQKTAGGFRWQYVDGIGVHNHPKWAKEKMKRIASENPIRKGKKLTPDQIEKNRLAHRGIPVGQYGLDGVLIKEWRCAPDAARSLHLDSASIHHICRGERHSKTLGGYIWKYLNTTTDPQECGSD